MVVPPWAGGINGFLVDVAVKVPVWVRRTEYELIIIRVFPMTFMAIREMASPWLK